MLCLYYVYLNVMYDNKYLNLNQPPSPPRHRAEDRDVFFWKINFQRKLVLVRVGE